MFVMQNKLNSNNEFHSLQTKSLYKMGAREFKKLNSFPIHCIRFVLQRAPLLFNQIFFKMQNSKKKTAPSKEVLEEIKAELQTLNPELKRLRVKKFYNKGRVTAHANLGGRRIHVRSSISNIIDKFIEQYNDRYPTAFNHLNTT